uniref:cAMP-dependent protein kinase inhibitor beta n=1 Tax=Oncorhynchus tshawytscha TaxID=74940 RepID=A0A8C8GFA4_ONCTS
MTDVEPVVTDFAATGRTGRRNAVPDIVEAGPADLSDKLAELSVVGGEKHGRASLNREQSTLSLIDG